MEAELGRIKLNLNIFIDDVQIDNRINNMIVTAKAYLTNLLGVPFDPLKPEHLYLLENRVRYDYNNVPELFELNFSSEILREQIRSGLL